jgi:hypothetical protein
MTEDNIFGLIDSDAAVAAEYYDTYRRREPLEPEKELMLALLQDAVHCYRKYSAACDRAGRERFREAQSWIMDTSTEGIFAFENVCDVLGIDPDYVRKGLRQWSEKQAAQSKFTRGEGLRRRAA